MEPTLDDDEAVVEDGAPRCRLAEQGGLTGHKFGGLSTPPSANSGSGRDDSVCGVGRA
jgi:hypothetical protein